MTRHRKNGFWAVLADALAPAPQTKPSGRTAQPEPRVPPPAPSRSNDRAQQWAENTLRLLADAHDGDSFQAAASGVFSMIAFEKDNGYVMSPYLPNLLLNMADIGVEIGEAHPEHQERIEWCMNEVMTLITTDYDPPPEVQERLAEIAPDYAEHLEEEPTRPLTWEDRPAELRHADEIIAWHREHNVPMKPYGYGRERRAR